MSTYPLSVPANLVQKAADRAGPLFLLCLGLAVALSVVVI